MMAQRHLSPLTDLEPLPGLSVAQMVSCTLTASVALVTGSALVVAVPAKGCVENAMSALGSRYAFS
jgi:hypothetical protein